MAVSIATLAIGAGIAIYGAVKKSQDQKKAAKAAEENKRPDYEIQQEEYDSQRLAESRANQGMGAQARQSYLNQANEGLAGTIGAAQRGGADANGLSGIYSNYEKGINSLSIYDDQARLSNLANLQNSFLRMSANKDKQWQLNTYAPWADKAQAITAKAQQDEAANNQMIQSGMNMGIKGLGGVLGGISGGDGKDDDGETGDKSGGAQQMPPGNPMGGSTNIGGGNNRWGLNSNAPAMPNMPQNKFPSGPQTYGNGYSPYEDNMTGWGPGFGWNAQQ